MNLIILLVLLVMVVMFFLSEREYDYKNKDRVTDLLPWGYSTKDGIIINKNGSLMITFKFKGKDFDSSTDDELNFIRVKINNILKRFQEGYIIHIEARRSRLKKYPESNFQEKLFQEMDNIRKEKNINGEYFESTYYINISYFLKKEKESKIQNTFANTEIEKLDFEIEKKKFIEKTNEIYLMLQEILLSVEKLNEEEILEYLHSTISLKEQKIKPMGEYVPLDSYISDTNITTGIIPTLGNKKIGVVSLLSYPDETFTSMLDRINKMSIEYRWTSRFIFIEKEKALKIAEEKRRFFFAERKGYFDTWFEKQTGEVIASESLEKLERVEECEMFKNDIESERILAGYYTFSIVLLDENEKILKENIQKIESIINSQGFVTVAESIGTLEAFIGSLPGDIEHNVRKDIMHTMNFIDLIPISSDFDGYKKNKHLDEEALIYCESGEDGSSSFKLNLHIGDVGHTMIIGPTGAGKSVLLGTLAYQFKKYKNSQIIFFDKDSSSKLLTRGAGGKFFDIGKDNLAFQPLRDIDDEQELTWAYEWLQDILEEEGLVLLSEHKKSLLQSLKSLISLKKDDRTITSLLLQGQNKDIRNILVRYTKSEDGVYGKFFDNSYDDFNSSNSWQVFEMGTLYSKKIMIPVMNYLFHKLEKEMFNGKPTLLLLDECWLMLDNPKFSEKIKEWLKTLRKKNVAVVFATQQLVDVAKSKIKDVLFESCYTKIYLPNREALSSDLFIEMYKSFGLNEKELELIKNGTMKRDYYYKSQQGEKVFKLNLNPLELAYIGATTIDDQELADEYKNLSTEEFNRKWKEIKKI